jgi:phosphoglycolate phosphatase-like HAD superfamily hydrolase
MGELREKIADAIAGAVSQDDRYLEHADAVLRVLAEHGGVKNLREQISLMVWRSANERAERAEEQAKKAKRWLIDAAGADVTDLLQSLDDCTARAERAEADLAAARQQLDRVRRLPSRSSSGMVRNYVLVSDLLAILDARHARHAGHDESGP